MSQKLLILSVVIHLILFYSIFDLHFRSIDLNKIVFRCNRTIRPSSKRLVLFIADGLSAHHYFKAMAKLPMENSFTRRIMQSEGSWGISTTYVPTVSKPCFIALVSGAKYESTTFWSNINVESLSLDHVFNKSNEVFYFGDPKIPYYFSNETRARWSIETWKPNFGDKVKSDFEKFNEFTINQLNMTLSNKKLRPRLIKDKVIFLFYFDAVDYCSHHYGPLSKPCQNIINNLDKHIQFVAQALEKYFGDNETSFLLTADHGVTNGGSHGGGLKMQVETPLLTWGAGVKAGAGGATDDLSSLWKVANLSYVRVRQSDLAPFIALLLGNPAPRHSSADLPLSLLTTDLDNIANFMYCGQKTLQRFAEEQAKSTTNYKPISNISCLIKTLDRLMNDTNKTEAINLLKKIYYLHREELKFYKNYFHLILFIVVTLIFIGWGICILLEVLTGVISEPLTTTIFDLSYFRRKGNTNAEKSILIELILDLLMLSIIVAFISLVFIKNWPTHLLIYFITATIIWRFVIMNIRILGKSAIYSVKLHSVRNWMLITSVCSSGIVFSFNQTVPRQISLLLITLLCLLVLKPAKVENIIKVVWILSAALLIFLFNYTILDCNPNIGLMEIGWISWILFFILYLYFNKGSNREVCWVFVMLLVTVLSIWNVRYVYYLNQNDQKILHIVLSWSILVVSAIFPLLSGQTGIRRLCHICFSLCPTFILMSIVQEAAGLMAFCLHLLAWYAMELRAAGKRLVETPQTGEIAVTNMCPGDFRRACMLLFYVYLGFFAIGNDTEPEGYDVKWTRCFVDGFNMAKMTGLIIYKMITPTIILASVFAMMYKHLEINRSKTLEWALFLSNICSLYIFHTTKGEGYTLAEISYSFTNFVMSLLCPVVLVIILSFIDFVNQGSIVSVGKMIKKYCIICYKKASEFTTNT